MKIGINAFFSRFPATGSGQYLIHLLTALAEIDTENEYVSFGPQALHNASLPTSTIPYVVESVPAIAARHEHIEKVVWEQLTGPAAARKASVTIFHVPYFAPPLVPRTPTVVTIHDVIPLRLPAYQGDLKVKAYMGLVARAAHSATLIITVSQHAKQDIMDVLKLPPERIRVTYEAAGKQYRPITDLEYLAQVRERYGIGTRYILYLGGLDQRKNVPQLVRAFAYLCKQLGDQQLQLLIAGDPDKQKGALFPDPRPIATELGISSQIIYRYIEEEDKPAVYSGAELFVFPSLYEGFGLTPLEAMSCGVPVVCSNRTSLPEVVGDAALLINPQETQELVQAMHRVLTDDELRASLRGHSLERAVQFSWRKTAQQTLQAYEEILARISARY
ncbi:MAG: glycosyltransferase family 4 protein [Ktedonobacteraceae bacterium]|nr:glycosyltransferase family 4 protein [Ktedonobacteraceae bacterium]